MKKIFFLLLAGFTFTNGSSQTTATNFTGNDCAGNPHDFFAELDAGKVIVLDWVMPCATCIGPSISAYNIAQGYQSSHPGRVLFYMVDDYANTSCSSLNGWATTNSMPNSVRFVNAAIDMLDYGSTGMPKIVVLGGTSHTIFYNANNSINTSTLTSAINSALAATTGIGENDNNIGSVALFPNPADSKTWISYSLTNNSDVKADIYNLVGEKITSVSYGKQSTGPNTISIDCSELSSGTYFVKLIAGTAEKTIKLSVSH